MEILNDKIGEQVKRKELVDSFSKHAKLSNKYMLGILLVSITIAMNITPTENINLAFIGIISIEYYYYISVALLSCLIILFSSSHLMALRIREYYNMFYNQRHDRDYIDLTVEPTIFRVAPISWMIKNKSVFFVNIEEINPSWRKFELIIYFILKLLVFIISYLFTASILAVILIKSGIFYFDNSANIIIKLFLVCLSITSIISFVIVWKTELIFTCRMAQKLFKEVATN